MLCNICGSRPQVSDGLCASCRLKKGLPAIVAEKKEEVRQTTNFNNVDVEKIKLHIIEMQTEYENQLDINRNMIEALRNEVSRLTNLLDKINSNKDKKPDSVETVNLEEELAKKQKRLDEMKKIAEDELRRIAEYEATKTKEDESIKKKTEKKTEKKVKRLNTMSKGKSPNANK